MVKQISNYLGTVWTHIQLILVIFEVNTVVLLKIQVFCDVMLCCWMNSSWRAQECDAFVFRVSSTRDYLTLNTKAIWSFETSTLTRPVTWSSTQTTWSSIKGNRILWYVHTHSPSDIKQYTDYSILNKGQYDPLRRPHSLTQWHQVLHGLLDPQ